MLSDDQSPQNRNNLSESQPEVSVERVINHEARKSANEGNTSLDDISRSAYKGSQGVKQVVPSSQDNGNHFTENLANRNHSTAQLAEESALKAHPSISKYSRQKNPVNMEMVNLSGGVSGFKVPYLNKHTFRLNYRKTGCLGRLLYNFSYPLIASINHNPERKMEEFMLEDMKEDPQESERTLNSFLANLQKRDSMVNLLLKKNNLPYYHKVMTAAVWDTFGPQIYASSFLYFLGECCGIAYTSFIQQFIKYIKSPDSEAKEGVALVAIFAAIMILQAFIRNLQIFKGYMTAVRVRKCLVSALYGKVSRLSMRSLTETNSGKLITIVNGDIQAIERPLAMISVIFAAPFVNIVGYSLIWYQVDGKSAGIAAGIWVVTLLLQHFTSKLTKYAKGKESECNDQRLKYVNDMVGGIGTIKSYGWENHYCEKIDNWRKKQSKYVLMQGILGSLGLTFFQNMGLITLIAILVPKWMNGEYLDEGVTISLMAMVFFLFLSVNSMTYYALSTYQQFTGIVERLGHVFGMEEYKSQRIISVPSDKAVVQIKDGHFSWGFKVQKDGEGSRDLEFKSAQERNKNESKLQSSFAQFKLQLQKSMTPVLSGINLDLKPGDFVAVIGKVGCGKTSLLMSIMNETNLTKGKSKVNGSIAYVEQSPYIMSDTLKNNITFGLEYEEERFERAIKVSQMRRDLQLFPKGIETEIGDKGLNISGGQKARISLARAVYSKADILLLDDPLSAVDPRVAKSMFRECISGALSDKIVILATHQLQFIENCPQILLLTEKGTVQEMGNYQEIKASGFNIKDIINSYNQTLKDKKVEQAPDDIELLAKNLDKDPTSPKSLQIHDSESSIEVFSPVKKSEDKTKLKLDLATQDDVMQGSVSFKDFKELFSFSVGSFAIFLFLFMSIIACILQLTPSYLIAYITKLPLEEQQSEEKYFYAFVWSIIGFILVAFFRSLIFIIFLVKANTNMHSTMVKRVARATMYFFDTNPLGRIVTRFSKDLTVLDLILAPISVIVAGGLFRTISVIIAVAIINPWILIIAVLCFIYMWSITSQGIRPMIEAQKFELLYYGPINQSMTSMVHGMVTLRSYDRFSYFRQRFIDDLEKSANATFGYIGSNRWIGIRLDLVCAIFGVSTAALAVAMKDQVEDRERLTFTLQIITDLIVQFSIAIRMYAEILNMMTCAKRIIKYTQLDQEDLLVKKQDNRLRQLAQWPSKGQISFKDVTMQYRHAMEPALKNLNFEITAGEKVGIIGRTGAGKTSLLQCLFRLAPHSEGKIMVDGQDLSHMGLHMLRQNISYIPQTPFLIQGTIRENIDPFDEFHEFEVKEALVKVNLEKFIRDNCPKGINTVLTESNSLFSSGQKQLLCLARALIKKSKIVLFDEATSNIDYQTDKIIQDTLRSQFKGSTVIMIAHRIASVIDADKIIVMERGEIKECDHPYLLMVNPVNVFGDLGLFGKMIYAMGEENGTQLIEISRQTWEKKFIEQESKADGPQK